MKQVLLLLLGVGALFAPEVLRAAAGGAAQQQQQVDADQGRSANGRVHIAFCTS